MSAIEYSAKRNFVPVSGAVWSATDISASNSTNNISTTGVVDFSGLVAGNWIFVSGFTNTVNNGWHVLDADSTATVLSCDTGQTVLTTESAGNTVDVRGFVNGPGDTVNMDFTLHRYAPQQSVVNHLHETMNGNVSGVYIFERYTYQITTGFIDETDIATWRQFFSSVSAAEQFTFDPYGTVSVPDNPVTVTLQGAPSFARLSTLLKHQISFTLREVV